MWFTIEKYSWISVSYSLLLGLCHHKLFKMSKMSEFSQYWILQRKTRYWSNSLSTSKCDVSLLLSTNVKHSNWCILFSMTSFLNDCIVTKSLFTKSIFFKKKQRHLLECGEVTVSCSNNCGAIFPRKFQGEHSTSCPLQLKTCEMCKAKVFPFLGFLTILWLDLILKFSFQVFAYKYEEHMTQHSKTTPIFLLPPSLPNNNKNKNDSHTPTQLSPHHSPAQSHRSNQISNSSSSSSTPSLPTNTTPTTRHRTSSQLQSSPPLQQTSNVC